jgi:hypothetical protein
MKTKANQINLRRSQNHTKDTLLYDSIKFNKDRSMLTLGAVHAFVISLVVQRATAVRVTIAAFQI